MKSTAFAEGDSSLSSHHIGWVHSKMDGGGCCSEMNWRERGLSIE